MRRTLFVKSFRNKICRLCGNKKFDRWLNLGRQPLANELLEYSPVFGQKKFPLNVVRCKSCGLFQLNYVVSPERLFANYKYFSSTSEVFVKHFKDLADELMAEKFVKKNDYVIDIGSNDGILLKPFKKLGANVLGIEPSTNLSDLANAQGIPTINDWLSPELALIIRESIGNKDVKLVTMTNVFAHIHDSESVLEAVKILIGKTGTLMIEVPDLEEMIKQGTFDLIYHEHLSYFSKQTIDLMLIRYGLLMDLSQKVNVHGGSLRAFARVFDTDIALEKFYKNNIRFEDRVNVYGFIENIQKNKVKTVSLVNKLAKDKVIVGYGVPAKSSTIFNFYKIGKKQIKFMIDDSPAKQGLYTPATYLKIYAPEQVNFAEIDYIFIFAWNFAESLKQKARDRGFKGQFIIPFPEVRVEK